MEMDGNEQLNIKSSGFEINENFFIAGIGASAGGLEALEMFFKNIKNDSGIAYVVVQHLSPDYKSLMGELLAKYTDLPIFRVEDGMKVQPNCIYLIPPKKNMTIFHGKLFLTEQTHAGGLNLPIDIFLRSLADDMADRAIGIILSGTGSDGALGIRAIKGAGGMVVVQDESTAKFDGMPRNAIATGMVDYVLAPEDMGEHLHKYMLHPLVAKNDKKTKLSIDDEDIYSKILAVIRSKVGTDFTYYKPNTIIRRIERRIGVHQLESIDDYLSLLMNSNSEASILYKDLLIGVTKFFRDQDAFSVVEEKLIPTLLENKKAGDLVRIWDVACSSGEEAYSLAILFKEYMIKHNIEFDLKIFATDIDKDSIEYASSGCYPESIAADVSSDRLNQFFTKSGDLYKINDSIRQMVIFATHNIIKDPPFSKIDMISCRNLLIYLQPIMQKKVISAFNFSLNPNGFLLLGTSESIGDLMAYYYTFDNKSKIYRTKEGIRAPLVSDFYMPLFKKKKIGLDIFNQSVSKTNPLELSIETLTKELFEKYIPASVLIDEKFELLHVFNNVNKFLKVPAGKVSLNILNMANSELTVPLSTAVHKCIKEEKEVIYKGLQVRLDDEEVNLNLIVKPVHFKDLGRNLLQISFVESKAKINQTDEEPFDKVDNALQRISDLELELQFNRENLQATIEELETSNEELQATNEELIASNEELQSTNEELQSVNEELYTVNSEYQNKIDELTELNNDISNWFSISNIGAIFLDLQLKIRKFSPAITKFINLLTTDIGRPINHISYNFEYKNFFEDIFAVQKTLKPIEAEVIANDKSWYLVKIMPYRTIENAVRGIVVTFIDISSTKKMEAQLMLERNLLIRVLDNSPTGKMMIDAAGYITFVNHKVEEIFSLSKEDIIGEKYNSEKFKFYRKENGKEVQVEFPLEKVINSKQALYNYKVKYITVNNDKIVYINASPIFDEEKRVIGAVFSIDDKRNLDKSDFED